MKYNKHIAELCNSITEGIIYEIIKSYSKTNKWVKISIGEISNKIGPYGTIPTRNTTKIMVEKGVIQERTINSRLEFKINEKAKT